jgi:hypothetical protein
MATNGESSSKTDNAVILVGLLQGVKKVLEAGQPWISLELSPRDECWDNAVAELVGDEFLVGAMSLSKIPIMISSFNVARCAWHGSLQWKKIS